MDSKLREKIATVILEQAITIHGCSAPCNCRSVADSILSLLAPVLADAEKWRKVEEMAKYKGNCGECPNDSLCMEFPTSACYICEGVVNALSKEAT